MSILINESFANDTNPLWASSSNNDANWSQFPAISSVDLQGNTIIDSYTNQVQLGNDINMNLHELVNAQIIQFNEQQTGLAIGNGSLPFCGQSYVPDTSATMPQLDPYNNPFNIDSAIGNDITNGEYNVTYFVSDNGNSTVQLTLNYNLALFGDPSLTDVISLYCALFISSGGYYANGDIFTPSNPMYFNLANCYNDGTNTWITGTYIDTFRFNTSIGHLYRNDMNIQIYTGYPSIFTLTGITGTVSATLEVVCDPAD